MNIPCELLDMILSYCDNDTLYSICSISEIKNIAEYILLKRTCHIPWEISADFTYETNIFTIHQTNIRIGWFDDFNMDITDEVASVKGIGGDIVVNCLFGKRLPNVLIKCIGEIDLSISYGDERGKNFYIVCPTEPKICELTSRYCKKFKPLRSIHHKNGNIINFFR